MRLQYLEALKQIGTSRLVEGRRADGALGAGVGVHRDRGGGIHERLASRGLGLTGGSAGRW